MYEEFRSLKNMTQKLKTKYEKFKTVLIMVNSRLYPFFRTIILQKQAI